MPEVSFLLQYQGFQVQLKSVKKLNDLVGQWVPSPGLQDQSPQPSVCHHPALPLDLQPICASKDAASIFQALSESPSPTEPPALMFSPPCAPVLYLVWFVKHLVAENREIQETQPLAFLAGALKSVMPGSPSVPSSLAGIICPPTRLHRLGERDTGNRSIKMTAIHGVTREAQRGHRREMAHVWAGIRGSERLPRRGDI